MRTPSPKLDPPIVGSSHAIRRVSELIERVADTPASVLITGESGTGKELVARNLHRLSRRGNRAFVAVNCAALSPGVLESELFGHGKGSFTGALYAHAGFFEQADGGTIFLDEIGEIPPAVQAKLLRVLQDREVRRLGAPAVKKVDVRVVSATNVDIERRIQAGEFRIDLFYRLNVVEIHLEPLRERPSDLPVLVAHFFSTRGLPPPALPADTLELLWRYAWPGNVRELENELERLCAIHGTVEVVAPSMLSERIVRGRPSGGLDFRFLCESPLPKAVGYLEENLLRRALEECNWNKSRTARTLGLSRQGLIKKMRRYGIARPPEAE